jgi:hypothetical protein
MGSGTDATDIRPDSWDPTKRSRITTRRARGLSPLAHRFSYRPTSNGPLLSQHCSAISELGQQTCFVRVGKTLGDLPVQMGKRPEGAPVALQVGD